MRSFRTPFSLTLLLMVPLARCGGESSGDSESPVDAGSADAANGADASADDCVPGTTEPCYGGPSGTNGLGACTGGLRLCGVDSTFGACAGEVLPQEESCQTPVDDDCDGATNEEGSDCVCVPGTVISCYSGPAATLGEGPCTAGEQVCLPTGVGYGACSGDVTPIAESCATSVDEDCDAEPECPGDVAWVVTRSDDGYTSLRSAAFGDSGKIGLLFDSPVTLEQLDGTGAFTLVQEFPGASEDQWLLGGEPSGTVQLLAGVYSGVPSWAPTLPGGSHDLFVMLRNGWQKAFPHQGNSLNLVAGSVNTTDTPPGWYLGGELYGTLELAPGFVLNGKIEPFVMKVASVNGNTNFARLLFDPVGTNGVGAGLAGIQATNQGAAVVGTFSTPVSLDGMLLSPNSSDDVFVAMLDGSGSALAVTTFGGQSSETVAFAGRAGNAPVVLAGRTYGMTIGTFQFASGTYLLRMSDDLKPQSAKQLPDCHFVAAALDDASASAYVVAYCPDANDFGGGMLPAGYVLVAFDENDQHRFSRAFPSKATVEHMLVRDEALYVAGTFEDHADFGTGVLIAQGYRDVFVVKYAK